VERGSNFVLAVRREHQSRTDFLFGFRYMDLDEGLDVVRQTALFPGVTVPFSGGFITARSRSASPTTSTPATSSTAPRSVPLGARMGRFCIG